MKVPVAQNVWSHFSRRRMSSVEVRHSFITYFVQNDHTHVPSSSILPEDESLLFTTAGMNQFKSIFLGENHSKWKGLNKAVSHQKCIRAGGKHNDLDDVGKDLHHQTFFEMLGNWSFNDAYDKETACRLAWSYLVDVLKIDPDRLYVTYFGRKETGQVDLECKRIWEKIGVPSRKIICFDNENFWEMGATGPCGGCTEIHYDRVPNRKDAAHLVNKDNSVIELWNIVFMNQNRDLSGQIQPLPKSHIDTGMGFERLVSVLQDVNSNYDTDLFSSLTSQLAKMSRIHSQYTGSLSPADSAIRLIADHIRGSTIAIQDGALPAHEGPGHIIRKMLRRSFLQGANTLKIDRGALSELVPIVADTLKSGYPELLTSIESIQKVVADEERNFWLTVDKAKRRFDKMVRTLGPETNLFPGNLAWELYTGNGLPVDITVELAREKCKEIDLDGFNKLKQQARLLGVDRSRSPVEGQAPSTIEVSIDFARPDGQRTRPLLVENKRLYVDEHYISVWSPILRAWCVECPDRELILANVQYEHVLEMLECIHPTYKAIDDQSVHVLLPLAYDYQMEGLLHRCECFLITHNLPFLEKVWIADRYKLNRLLILMLREMRPNSKMDLSGTRYYALSDRVKVLLLERLHGSPSPEELPEPPLDMEHFQRPTDIQFAVIRAKTGRAYHVNPYYVAAWSNVFQDRVYCSTSTMEELFAPCSPEELKAFLMAIHPPQLRINEQNIGPVLMAACKMESPALLRKCASILLNPHTQLSVFVRLSLLDRCFLHEMLPSCLNMIQRPEHLLQMTQQSTYNCLSTRAKGAMLDRLTELMDNPGLQQHQCKQCKTYSSCHSVSWMCPNCRTHCSADSSLMRPPANMNNLPR